MSELKSAILFSIFYLFLLFLFLCFLPPAFLWAIRTYFRIYLINVVFGVSLCKTIIVVDLCITSQFMVLFYQFKKKGEKLSYLYTPLPSSIYNIIVLNIFSSYTWNSVIILDFNHQKFIKLKETLFHLSTFLFAVFFLLS